MFQYRGNHVLKGATIKGKNMLPIGSLFFHLKVDPMRKENRFKGITLRNRQTHAGKGLKSWPSFVVSNCEFVTFPLVSWVRCGT